MKQADDICKECGSRAADRLALEQMRKGPRLAKWQWPLPLGELLIEVRGQWSEVEADEMAKVFELALKYLNRNAIR